MLAKRIIACLDVKSGRTVKGVQFESLVDAGDAVDLGRRYSEEGIDELVFLDIAATLEERKTFTELVGRIATEIQIPFTVGGGISKLKDVERLLRAGADKVSVNSAALENPNLITEVANEFGSQCIVVAIDSKQSATFDKAFKHSGKTETEWETLDWVREVESLGAGEILLTAIENDGGKKGFNCTLTRKIAEAVNIPIIASGGAGESQHFLEVFQDGKADAALAASIFHFGAVAVADLKQYLKDHLISVRI